MSKDGLNWTTLVDHQEDNRLTEPGSTATWRINVDRDSEESKAGWRHIRLQQNGKNSSGQTHYLSLSGMEIYGTVLDVCDDLGKGAVAFKIYGLRFMPQNKRATCFFQLSKKPKQICVGRGVN